MDSIMQAAIAAIQKKHSDEPAGGFSIKSIRKKGKKYEVIYTEGFDAPFAALAAEARGKRDRTKRLRLTFTV